MKRFLDRQGFLGARWGGRCGRARAGGEGERWEQAKHFKWGLNDFVLDRILNTEFTDVAQVANAARNIEIFHDRSKNEGNNKRDRDGHRIRPSETPSQGSNQRAYDRRIVPDMATRAWRDQDQQVRGQQCGRSYGSSSQSRYSDYASSPLCNICGKLHLGKACHRATGACFECGEVGQSLMMVTLFTRYVDMVVSSAQRTLDIPD
ncbi:hypothetical protein Tco_0836797 [Tanacetum coccineum]